MKKFLTIFWDRKWTGNGPEMDQKWTGNGSEMDQNGPKLKFLPFLFIILDHLASICYVKFLTIFWDKKWTGKGPEIDQNGPNKIELAIYVSNIDIGWLDME